MRCLITRLALVAVVAITGGLSLAMQYASGTLEGTFWVDRWGQGRFAPGEEFVDESLFGRLRAHVGIPIRLISPRIGQGFEESEATCIMKFEKVEKLPQPVSVRLRWLDGGEQLTNSLLRRMRRSQIASFEVQLKNNSNDELVLDTNEFMFFPAVRHPPGLQYNGYHPTFGENNKRPQRGVLRYHEIPSNLSPKDTKFDENPPGASFPQPGSENPVRVKSGATYSWNVTLTNWDANEYELKVRYRKYFDNPNIRGGSVTFSNSLYLDVLSDEPRKNNRLELRVQQREKTEFQLGKPVPLEIVFRNRSNAEMRLPFLERSQGDLDLSDLLFCYGEDGRVLPLKTKVPGPIEIRIPVEGSFTLPVDAPAGTEVARTVFVNQKIAPPYPPERDPARFNWGWHWSEHWIAPSIRQRLDAPK
jgi:hypothetical protein